MTAVLMIFRRFPTTFRRFPTIFQNCSEGQSNVSEHFQTEDFQRLVKISEDGRKCFDQQYTKEIKWVKGTKVKCYQNDIFTCDDIISFSSIWYQSVYRQLLYNKINFTEDERARRNHWQAASVNRNVSEIISRRAESLQVY